MNLVKVGANIESKDYAGATPRILAARNGRVDIVEFLLKNNADIEAEDERKRRPLHEALRLGNHAVRLLLQWDANIEARNDELQTPLHVACLRHYPIRSQAGVKAAREIGQLLLDRAADPHAKDEYGRTVLHLAEKKSHAIMYKLLSGRGVRLHLERLELETWEFAL